jgi:hypothetical protein
MHGIFYLHDSLQLLLIKSLMAGSRARSQRVPAITIILSRIIEFSRANLITINRRQRPKWHFLKGWRGLRRAGWPPQSRSRMAGQFQRETIIAVLLERYGRTFCSELGIDIARNTPSVLFRLLCASLLYSARIRTSTATSAARALTENGWTTAKKLAASTWEDRVGVLNAAGYARYDESTSRRLGQMAELLQTEYGGDLRRLRAAAAEQPAAERTLLMQFKGIGAVGADIFCREAQLAWPELYPFAGQTALASAQQLGIANDAQVLAGLVKRETLPRLIAALIRVKLARAQDDVIRLAGNQPGNI